MRRPGSLLEMRGTSAGVSNTPSLSGSDNSVSSLSSRRGTITRRSFGDPPPLPGKKAAIAPAKTSVTAPRSGAPGSTTSRSVSVGSGRIPIVPSTAVRGVNTSTPTSTSVGTSTSRPVTIIHKPTKEARKAEIVAAVTKRLYTQRKVKPEGRDLTPSLPEQDEPEDEEPAELKLCSNARARLQEISKRALAFSLHRKRRDVEVQTEPLGTQRVKERAVGTDVVQRADKSSQWPPLPPLYCPMFWPPPMWTSLQCPASCWRRRHRYRLSSDSRESSDEALSDDSLEVQTSSSERTSPSVLWKRFTLKSGRRFAPMDIPRCFEQASQTLSEYTQDETTDNNEILPGVRTGRWLLREAQTMTSNTQDKATMTTMDAQVGTVSDNENPNSVGTSTCEDFGRDMSTMTIPEDYQGASRTSETTTGITVDFPSPSQPAGKDSARLVSCSPAHLTDPHIQLVCDVRLAYPSMASTCSCDTGLLSVSAPAVQGQAKISSAGQKTPIGITEDRAEIPGNHSTTSPPRKLCRCGLPTASAAPPDIIAEASSGNGDTAKPVEKTQITKDHIHVQIQDHGHLSLDSAHNTLHPGADASRSRSLDSLLHNLQGHAGVEEQTEEPPPPLDSATVVSAHVHSVKKFRLPCFVENGLDSPKPTATARAIDVPSEHSARCEEPRGMRDDRPALTAKQIRLLLNLMDSRRERRAPRKRKRIPVAPLPMPPIPPPLVPVPAFPNFMELRPSRSLSELFEIVSDSRQSAMLNFSNLLGEAAQYVKNMNQRSTLESKSEPREPSNSRSTPARVATVTTKYVHHASTQCVSNASVQCAKPTKSRGSQYDIPTSDNQRQGTQLQSDWTVWQRQALLDWYQKFSTTVLKSRSVQTDCELVAWEDDDPLQTGFLSNDAQYARRKAYSMVDLASDSEQSWNARSALGRQDTSAWDVWGYHKRSQNTNIFVRSSWERRWGRRPLHSCPLSSPRQYLRHLITLRKGVVLASRAGHDYLEAERKVASSKARSDQRLCSAYKNWLV